MRKQKKPVGLALEGGGAKGAFHMGAVKALNELGYSFEAVAGTSIGALNGAIIAQNDFELGYEWWQKIDTAMLFDIDKEHMDKLANKQLSHSVIKSLISIAREMLKSRGLDTGKIKQVLSEVIDEKKVRKSKTDFGLVTVSLSDLKPLELFLEDIPEGMLIDYLMASAYLPAFKQKQIDGKYFLDGGFYDNCPINMLGKRGCKEVVAVRTLSLGRNRRLQYKDINVVEIIPSKDLGKILVFDNNTIEENLKMGYCDTLRSLEKVKGNTYYIDSDLDDTEIL